MRCREVYQLLGMVASQLAGLQLSQCSAFHRDLHITKGGHHLHIGAVFRGRAESGERVVQVLAMPCLGYLELLSGMSPRHGEQLLQAAQAISMSQTKQKSGARDHAVASKHLTKRPAISM